MFNGNEFYYTTLQSNKISNIRYKYTNFKSDITLKVPLKAIHSDQLTRKYTASFEDSVKQLSSIPSYVIVHFLSISANPLYVQTFRNSYSSDIYIYIYLIN